MPLLPLAVVAYKFQICSLGAIVIALKNQSQLLIFMLPFQTIARKSLLLVCVPVPIKD
jgi:hypothetical protein